MNVESFFSSLHGIAGYLKTNHESTIILIFNTESDKDRFIETLGEATSPSHTPFIPEDSGLITYECDYCDNLVVAPKGIKISCLKHIEKESTGIPPMMHEVQPPTLSEMTEPGDTIECPTCDGLYFESPFTKEKPCPDCKGTGRKPKPQMYSGNIIQELED